MPKLIKDGAVSDNTWQRQTGEIAPADLPAGNLLVSLSYWQEHRSELASRAAEIGLTLENTEDVTNAAIDFNQFPVIEVFFPAFMDGRGFSQGRLLRERCGYTGELRAGGKIIRDQLCYLRRCGFNAFAFDDASIDLEKAVASLTDFTDGYQPSVDQPAPLFVRR